MIKNSLLKFGSLLLLLVSLACGMIIPLLSLTMESHRTGSFAYHFVEVRDQLITPGSFSTQFLYIAIPLSLFLIFITNASLDDEKILKTYLFLRLKSLNRWFVSNTVVLGVLSFLSALFYHLGIMAVLWMFHITPDDNSAFAAVFLYGVGSMFLLNLITSILANMISFFTTAKNAILAGITFIVASSAVVVFLPQGLIKYFWLSHYFIQWHTPSSVLVKAVNGELPLKGSFASVPFSIVFLCAITAVELLVYRKLIEKADFI